MGQWNAVRRRDVRQQRKSSNLQSNENPNRPLLSACTIHKRWPVKGKSRLNTKKAN
jgi:hypothetical protein